MITNFLKSFAKNRVSETVFNLVSPAYTSQSLSFVYLEDNKVLAENFCEFLIGTSPRSMSVTDINETSKANHWLHGLSVEEIKFFKISKINDFIILILDNNILNKTITNSIQKIYNNSDLILGSAEMLGLFNKHFLSGTKNHSEENSEGNNISLISEPKQPPAQITLQDTSLKNKEALFVQILDHLSQLKKDKLVYSCAVHSKKILDLKHSFMHNHIERFARFSAATGILPLPGVDIMLDLSLISKMNQGILNCLHLDASEAFSKAASDKDRSWQPEAQRLSTFVSKEVIKKLLRSNAKKFAAAKFSKALPILGSLTSAAAGYAFTKWIGTKLLNDCIKTLNERFSLSEKE